jgi:hypothetical protein
MPPAMLARALQSISVEHARENQAVLMGILGMVKLPARVG